MPKGEFYSIKEMLEEVRKQNQDAFVVQASILSEIKSMHDRLDQVAATVEANNKRITQLETFKDRAMFLWAGATFVFTTGVTWMINKIF